MTIRELIKREHETTLGFSLNHHLESIKEWKEKAENLPFEYAKEFYLMEKGFLKGMVHTLYLAHAIAETEYLEIQEDIRENY